ncbi:hypothetical protein BS17DRAFT_232367 [Gyrodon lividus]|nr:hypothetical protein BS17DRAFT_232367 [Gyrodon lividus]
MSSRQPGKSDSRFTSGTVFADMLVFVQIAMNLSVFDSRKATESGKVITPEAKQTTGVIRYMVRDYLLNSPGLRHHVSIPVRNRSRSSKAVELVHIRSADDADHLVPPCRYYYHWYYPGLT